MRAVCMSYPEALALMWAAKCCNGEWVASCEQVYFSGLHVSARTHTHKSPIVDSSGCALYWQAVVVRPCVHGLFLQPDHVLL
jgi:hypothetical protein